MTVRQLRQTRTYYGWNITGDRGHWYAERWTPAGIWMLTACPCRTLADARQAILKYEQAIFYTIQEPGVTWQALGK